MPTATADLFCFGGGTPPVPQQALVQIDLGADQNFLAWIAPTYWNVLTGGILGDLNSVVADVLAVLDSSANLTFVAPVAISPRLDPFGAPVQIRPSSFQGFGQFIWFRLLVWGSALEVASRATVLFPV